MNHKEFCKNIKSKNFFDLENLIILEEQDYDLKKGKPGKPGKHGEIDEGLINQLKNYAYVIEYKSTKNDKTYTKACIQCSKDVQMVYEQYGISKNRIFKFVAFGHRKDDSCDIIYIGHEK